MNDDPANWPTAMNNNVRDYLAMKSPPSIPGNSFPRNGKELCFSKFYCKGKLLNGESVERPWIVYSKSADRIYGFCCKLFIRMHPRPYQLVDSTIGLMFTQGYVSIKNQRTI